MVLGLWLGCFSGLKVGNNFGAEVWLLVVLALTKSRNWGNSTVIGPAMKKIQKKLRLLLFIHLLWTDFEKGINRGPRPTKLSTQT
jgi:hypothetical protein